jgi:hypothetical protein
MLKIVLGIFAQSLIWTVPYMTFYRHVNAFFAIPSAVRHARPEDTTFSPDDVPGKTAGDFQAT